MKAEDEVRRLAPDFARLSTVEARGVIVTSRSADSQYDFVSRFFAPRAGVNEDPVTGSAHCCLGPYWQGRMGKNEFIAFQASARGGVVCVCVAGDRTYLGGKAVSVLRGELVAYRQTLEEFEKWCGKISKPETYSHPHGQPYKATIKRREDMLRVCELENLEDQYSERCRDGVVQSIRATSLPKDDEYQDRADRQLQAVENDF